MSKPGYLLDDENVLLIRPIVKARVAEDHLGFYHSETWTFLRVMMKIFCLNPINEKKLIVKCFKSPGADLLRISNELQLEFIIEKVCWQMSNYEN